MDLRARIFVIAVSFGILLFVLNLVRKKYLKENYAIMWVLTFVIMSIVPLFINYLDKIAYAVGISYPPALLYLMALMFIFVLILHFSVIVSKLSDQNKTLIQELGILESKIKQFESNPNPRITNLNGGRKELSEANK
jgi:hypothetical protein